MRNGKPLTRYVVLATALGLVLALAPGAPTEVAAAAQGRTEALASQSAPEHGCGSTWIQGVTDNRTDMPLRVAQTGQRPTNQWCREPENVREGDTNAWLGGDPSGTTELTIGYLLGNGDRIFFCGACRQIRVGHGVMFGSGGGTDAARLRVPRRGSGLS